VAFRREEVVPIYVYNKLKRIYNKKSYFYKISCHYLSHTYIYIGVKPLIHQSELANVFLCKEKKFLSPCSIVKTTEWNRIIKIEN